MKGETIMKRNIAMTTTYKPVETAEISAVCFPRDFSHSYDMPVFASKVKIDIS